MIPHRRVMIPYRRVMILKQPHSGDTVVTRSCIPKYTVSKPSMGCTTGPRLRHHPPLRMYHYRRVWRNCCVYKSNSWSLGYTSWPMMVVVSGMIHNKKWFAGERQYYLNTTNRYVTYSMRWDYRWLSTKKNHRSYTQPRFDFDPIQSLFLILSVDDVA